MENTTNHNFISSQSKSNSILEKIKLIKKKADELNSDYHEIIEKLKFNQKDVEFMQNKIKGMDCNLDNTLQDHG